jgi:hypothetical protein
MRAPKTTFIVMQNIVLSLMLFFNFPAWGVVKPSATPILRGTNAFHQMKLSPKGRYLAYTDENGLGLNAIDLKTKFIYRVSDEKVGQSFFWTPDGSRIFYRELVRSPLKKPRTDSDAERKENQWETPIRSKIRAFDCSVARNIDIDTIPRTTGLLTFDPRDLRFLLLSESGIHTKKITFPNQRLAQWQIASRNDEGKWLATQKGILWVTQRGLVMRRLEDDSKNLSSFDISPDGQWIAWSTEGDRIYISHEGKMSQFLAYGRDPKWHPTRQLIAFAGARMVGNKAVNFDIKIADVRGQAKFLTATQFSSERWPHWDKEGEKIMYTVDQTTDLFLLDFKQ